MADIAGVVREETAEEVRKAQGPQINARLSDSELARVDRKLWDLDRTAHGR